MKKRLRQITPEEILDSLVVKVTEAEYYQVKHVFEKLLPLLLTKIISQGFPQLPLLK